jgi:hypothetical protein
VETLSHDRRSIFMAGSGWEHGIEFSTGFRGGKSGVRGNGSAAREFHQLSAVDPDHNRFLDLGLPPDMLMPMDRRRRHRRLTHPLCLRLRASGCHQCRPGPGLSWGHNGRRSAQMPVSELEPDGPRQNLLAGH